MTGHGRARRPPPLSTGELITFGDVTIPAGQRVLPLIASANRDPRGFPDPDAARPESTVAIESLFRLGLTPRLAGEPERINSPVVRGLRP
ncbi:hypothetical protein ACIBF1_35635 [Spirillospora sp. NPDC050679]